MRISKLYIATGNAHKVQELHTMLTLADINIEVCSPDAFGGMPEVVEDAATFAGNALLKAKALLARVGPENWVLADDSGIVVDALGGAPGVYSARFAGDACDNEANNALLLKKLANVPAPQRSARFVCCLALLGQGQEMLFNGSVEGEIGFECKGKLGFGYDPLFIPKGYAVTMGELQPSVKNKISHRAVALEKLILWLRSSP